MFAEWHTQKGIVLIYPHKFCDFNDGNLDMAQKVFDEMIYEIAKIELVFLILHPDDKSLDCKIANLKDKYPFIKENCIVLKIKTNDIWARDSLFLSIKNARKLKDSPRSDIVKNKNNKNLDTSTNNNAQYLNFGFNGWGLKFKSDYDNLINLEMQKIVHDVAQKKVDSKIIESMPNLQNLQTIGMILEGGSIDCNGAGFLLTNTQCLLQKNRNAHLSKMDIEKYLKKYLRIKQVLWLNHGFLKGDDTDSHIDTLARFINKNTICYIKCDDKKDEHYDELNLMQKELENLANEFHLNLVALPFCKYIDDDNEELPASYANFLFINNHTLLMPTYQKPSDFVAFQILQKALKNYKIVGIDCRALIKQHGSLHCASMQIH